MDEQGEGGVRALVNTTEPEGGLSLFFLPELRVRHPREVFPGRNACGPAVRGPAASVGTGLSGQPGRQIYILTQAPQRGPQP